MVPHPQARGARTAAEGKVLLPLTHQVLSADKPETDLYKQRWADLTPHCQQAWGLPTSSSQGPAGTIYLSPRLYPLNLPPITGRKLIQPFSTGQWAELGEPTEGAPKSEKWCVEGTETTWPVEGAGQGPSYSVNLEPFCQTSWSEGCSLGMRSDRACTFSKPCNVVRWGQTFTKANFLLLLQRLRAVKPLWERLPEYFDKTKYTLSPVLVIREIAGQEFPM